MSMENLDTRVSNLVKNSKIKEFLLKIEGSFDSMYLIDKISKISDDIEIHSLNEEELENYFKELEKENIPDEVMKEVFIFMIENGVPEAVLFRKRFNIDVPNIPVSFFPKMT